MRRERITYGECLYEEKQEIGGNFMSTRRRLLVAGLTIIVILAVIAISGYQSVVLKSKEEVLRNNLTEMRRAIKQYINDKQRAPQSLQDLVDAGYFRELPIDPITNSNSSWKPVKSDRGITDLQSGSSAVSSNGTAYSVW
jgi:general secretion pathway protein G